jgi:hypothetical protein
MKLIQIMMELLHMKIYNKSKAKRSVLTNGLKYSENVIWMEMVESILKNL